MVPQLPEVSSSTILSFPAPSILLITLNRPRALNAIPYAQHWELDSVLNWYDAHPDLRCAIITGSGKKAFCAGQDLIELGRNGALNAGDAEKRRPLMRHPASGFAGISRRAGKKPIVAAVNGLALGGGFEIVLNWYSL